MPKLGVNIDHVATLRQARRECDPDPIQAVRICERAGAHSIVAHLREDRRHINDQDIKRIRQTVTTQFNLEMSLSPEIVKIAAVVKPDVATIVPERRAEVTTEGGLDVVANFLRIKKTVAILQDRGIEVSLFIDPVQKQVEYARKSGAEIIEFHTGQYAHAKTKKHIQTELNKIRAMTRFAQQVGLVISAGHGLNYNNTAAIARIPGIAELNIGHSIISLAVFVGLEKAVKDMLHLAKG
ncbi:MAG: pyridoxine 5'-phosphate synthase [Omnitrophica WOR_2 bacterium RIFCSPHIGHO2_01_FULL_48_9]|nr:MAG: pyridoxine 5'-phosphate synthase [Omnitrophica WOR_2 bacterium RIFCSPHIGHO2_02_FULL_48_11]OGX30053.1 MAG: pyridoxine 5'-phosphate synthase [Omnitrophica WOR_2 bacterium RIFCSPHIGHO2_01_FULL_48_9]